MGEGGWEGGATEGNMSRIRGNGKRKEEGRKESHKRSRWFAIPGSRG